MIKIETGDFRELNKDIADDSIDLILTDPPYTKEFLPLWNDLGRVAVRVLRPSGFLIAYSGNHSMNESRKSLNKYLEWYWEVALLLLGPRPRFWSKHIWVKKRPILIYAKPPISIQPGWFADVITSPAKSKEYHKWGQSVDPMRYLINKFSMPDSLVYDPFLGGGTTAVACYQTGRNCIGHEIDPQVAEDARKRLAETQPPLPGLVVGQSGLM